MLTVPVTQVPGSIDASFDYLRCRIRELTQGGAADRAGLAIGDEVIEVDGLSVVDLGPTAMLLITQRPADTTATLTVVRGGQQRKVVVTVRGAN